MRGWAAAARRKRFATVDYQVSINIPVAVYIPIQNTTTQLFQEKKLTGKYCASPFISIEIDSDGRVRMCACASWMPTTIGNIFDASLIDLLNSSLAQSVRQSIRDGNYRYCNEQLCGTMTNNDLVEFDRLPVLVKPIIHDPTKFVFPYEIFLAGDTTCNLSCPSCRKTVIKHTDDQTKRLEALGETVYKNLFGVPTDQPLTLTLSTSGELFASPLLLKLIEKLDNDCFPNLRLSIQTNGLLAPKNWHRLGNLEKQIKMVTVSIDAVAAITYEKLRRGGTWSNLLRSMQFLQEKKAQCNFQLVTRMVVQKSNLDEMVDFYQFSKSFSADLVEYTRLTNWGTWTQQEFAQNDVGAPEHTQYQTLLEKFSILKNKNDIWFSGFDFTT